jgi:hypothetical protein
MKFAATNRVTAVAALLSTIIASATAFSTIIGLPVVFDSGRHNLQPGATILLSQGDLPIATVELTDKYLPNKPVGCKSATARLGN